MLVNFVLMALPVYYMSVIQLTQWLIKVLNKKCRGFLWKGEEHISGGHYLVSWEKVCMPKELGGLGIKNLTLFGMAMCLKWECHRWLDTWMPTSCGQDSIRN